MTPKSSKNWLKEHFTDAYVKQAHQSGFRSRAIFKLKELQERDHLFKPGMVVIDLGAAPGSWSAYVAKIVSPSGHVIALDLLPMDPIPGVEIMQGDFSEEAIEKELLQKIARFNHKVDWVISDMAPNMSGNESVDIPRAIYLAELALDLSLRVLRQKGGFLIKLFQGEGFEEQLKTIKQNFSSVVIRKPKASKSHSREVYILARNLKGLEETKD